MSNTVAEVKEKRKTQANQQYLAGPCIQIRAEHLVRPGPGSRVKEPNTEDNESNAQRNARRAMQDRRRHCNGPAIDREMRRQWAPVIAHAVSSFCISSQIARADYP